jgi:predicted DNA-binding protein YlxM (UPF0122 family)
MEKVVAMAQLDSKLLEDPQIAKQALRTILRTKRELDDLVDTLELLSNPRFRKNLEEGIKEARGGKAVKLTTKKLRKRTERISGFTV